MLVAVDVDGTGDFTVHLSVRERSLDGQRVEKLHRVEYEIHSAYEESGNWLRDVLLGVLEYQ